MKKLLGSLLNILAMGFALLSKGLDKLTMKGQVENIKIEMDPWLVAMLGIILVADGWKIFLFWILMFVFIFLHELAHTFVARKLGYETPKIVLQPLGAAVQILGLGNNPRDEFLIAIAGPLCNLGIACILILCNFTASPFIHTLVLLNTVLAVFNLLPIYPMDGGRILRGATRMVFPSMSVYDATKKVVKVGWVLMGIGLAACVAYCSITTILWMTLIAFFLWLMGTAELNARKMQQDGSD